MKRRDLERRLRIAGCYLKREGAGSVRSAANDYHVVILDIAVFGESSQIGTVTYDAESQVKRIDRLIQELKLEKFNVAGIPREGCFGIDRTASPLCRFPEEHAIVFPPISS